MREAHDTLTAEEVAPLLLRLTAEEFPAPSEVQTTVRDVAEATGLTESQVREKLREMRRSRLSEELRILEEPLYRVERPGFVSSEPISDYLARERTLNTLLDAKRPEKTAKPVEPPKPNDQWITLAILVPLFTALGYFLVRAVLAA